MRQPSASRLTATPTEVLDFWLADGWALGWPTKNLNSRWFQGSAALDEDIRHRFGTSVALAMAGELRHWESHCESRLALVILLDQFTRNVFRGTARAFEGDEKAQQLTLQTLADQQDQSLPWVARVFTYMPLMHAEAASLQAQSVACFSQLVAEAPPELKPKLQGSLDFAHQHQRIIDRFGRFPYRNAALGRSSTPTEQAFLVNGPRFGQ